MFGNPSTNGTRKEDISHHARLGNIGKLALCSELYGRYLWKAEENL